MEYLLLPLAALPFPDIDPILIRVGPLAVHWYGLGYVVGILFSWWYTKRLLANDGLWRGNRLGRGRCLFGGRLARRIVRALAEHL